MAYLASRPGKDLMELWSQSLDGGRAEMLGEAPHYFGPRLSSAGSHVLYRVVRRRKPPDNRVAWMPIVGGAEHALPEGVRTPFGLVPRRPPGAAQLSPPRALCRAVPVAPGRHKPVPGAAAARRSQARPVAGAVLAGWPLDHLQRAEPRPDRHIGARHRPGAGRNVAALVGSRAVGRQTRWAPDGKTIYFISNKDGAFSTCGDFAWTPRPAHPSAKSSV
jgi:hypothetical protein